MSERIRAGLQRSAVRNVDATGCILTTRRERLHTTNTPTLMPYTAHTKRGCGAHEATGILPGYRRTIVHDSYDSYFTYTCRHDFAVPFDNSEAERDLRMVKVEEKISGGFCTRAGAASFCTIRGYLVTAGKQGRSALAVLRDLFADQSFMPAVPE